MRNRALLHTTKYNRVHKFSPQPYKLSLHYHKTEFKFYRRQAFAILLTRMLGNEIIIIYIKA